MDAKVKPTWMYSRPEGSALGVRRLQKLTGSFRYGILSKKCKGHLFDLGYPECYVFVTFR